MITKSEVNWFTMPAVCEKCKQVVSPQDKQVNCDCCRVIFHLTEDCAGMSTSEQRAIVLQKRCLLYFCGECRDAFKAAPLVIRRVKELQEEVNTLKQELQALRMARQTPDNIEQILSESHERSIRSKNIMVYDAPESSANDIQGRILHDKHIAQQIFEKVGCQNKVADILKVMRVGKGGVNNKPRPLKVVCSNTEIVNAILRSRKRMDPNSYKVGYDSTKMQQAAYKAARAELMTRRDKGEDDLIIKYVKGVPTIMKNQNRRVQEN